MSLIDPDDLPDDDTDPDEHGNEPRECVVCEMYLDAEDCVQTTNRAPYGVNTKLWLDPVCEAHDNADIETKVTQVLDYGGIGFVADAVRMGVFTREEAVRHLTDDEAYDLNQELQHRVMEDENENVHMADYSNPADVIDIVNGIAQQATMVADLATDPIDAIHIVVDDHDLLQLSPTEKVEFIETLDEALKEEFGEGVDHSFALEMAGSQQTLYDVIDSAFYDVLVSTLERLYEGDREVIR